MKTSAKTCFDDIFSLIYFKFSKNTNEKYFTVKITIFICLLMAIFPIRRLLYSYAKLHTKVTRKMKTLFLFIFILKNIYIILFTNDYGSRSIQNIPKNLRIRKM